MGNGERCKQPLAQSGITQHRVQTLPRSSADTDKLERRV